ncbi:MAG: methyltransferase domain-containing protein [Gemmatimonadota bacterium]
MSNRVAQFFDENVADYDAKHYSPGARTFMTVRQRRMLEFVDGLRLPAGAKVLDAGCGPGYMLSALAQRGFDVSGLDAAPEMLRMSKERLRVTAPERTFALELGSIESLPFAAESFDLVCTAGVVEYLESDRLVLQEMHRVLRPGGHLLYPVTNLLSPVDYLDFAVEYLKRRPSFLRAFNAVWMRLGHPPVLPRHFHVRRHRPGALRDALAQAGFALDDSLYFFFLPLPRPFDKLLPGVSTSIGQRMEGLSRSWLGALGEGYLTLSRKRVVG